MSTNARGSRQSFLGDEAQDIFATTFVAVLGLGGGGSHIVQQLAHIGFQRFLVLDPDRVEETNLNRLVGATEEDARVGTYKVDVAKRVIGGLATEAVVESARSRWQDEAEQVRAADLVFGCLDGFGARRELEEFTRRYLIPLIDIGLDVHQAEGWPPRMSGQVIASIPGAPCMWCFGFLDEARLTQEATKYGAAGVRPQVVWANGVLASAAVGMAVDLLTGWTREPRVGYLEYDGSKGTLKVPARMQYLRLGSCPHFPTTTIMAHGDPVFNPR